MTLKPIVILILFLTGTIQLSGNSLYLTTDSIKFPGDNSTHDTIKAELLLQMGAACLDCDSTAKYLETALNLAKKHRLQALQARALLLMGNRYENLGEIYDALEIYKHLVESGKILKDKVLMVQGYNNTGRVYKSLGDLIKAMENFQLALALSEKAGYKKGIANAYHNIGTIYRSQNEMEKALNYNQLSLKIRKETRDYKGIAESYQNIANCYDQKKDFVKMLEYHQLSLKIREDIKDSSGIAYSLNNIGVLYRGANDLDKALEFSLKSYQIFKELGNTYNMSYLLYNIGTVYHRSNNTDKAAAYAQQSLEIAEKHNFTERRKYAAQLLSEIYASKNNFSKAFEMQLLSNAMEKKLNQAEVSKTLARYEFEKKEAIIKAEQLKKDIESNFEIERQKTLRNWSISGSLLFISSAGIIIFFYKRRRDAEIQLEIADSRMKAINAQLNQHFIFSSLSSIRSYMQANFDKADEYLVRFAKFVRSILNHSDTDTISLQQELDETENYMVLEQFRFSNKFEYEILIDPELDPEEYMVPPLVFQPIVENSIKHGFDGISYKGKITIQIKLNDNTLICEISDNGTGFKRPVNEHDSKRKSFGTRLTIERIHIFNKINNQKAEYKVVELAQGTKTVLNLPAIC